MRYYQHAYGQHFDDTYPFYSEQLVQCDAVQSNSPLTAGYLPERQRPVFMLTSDSGASIQSAMSSSKGSHTCQTQQYNDWNRFNIKPYPRDLQYENIDSTFAFGMERVTGDVEVGYVGEFTQIYFCHGTLSILASASTPTEGPWTRFQLVITEWLRVRHTSCRDFCWRPGQAVHCTARSQRTTICSNSQHRPRRPLSFLTTIAKLGAYYRTAASIYRILTVRLQIPPWPNHLHHCEPPTRKPRMFQLCSLPK
jgi:hypothetical protein